MLQILLLVALTGVLIFCVFSIVRVVFKPKPKPAKAVEETMYDVPYMSSFEEAPPPSNLPPPMAPHERVRQVPEEEPAPIREPIAETISTPVISGQSEEEIQEPEPLQKKVSQKVELPTAKDPHEHNDNIALFGSNLRHPESMITKSTTQFASLEEEVSSGIAGEVTKPANVEQLPFSAEMAQNGGEFMKGIFAFDTSDSNTTFSSWE
jgi:hypothetical protein